MEADRFPLQMEKPVLEFRILARCASPAALFRKQLKNLRSFLICRGEMLHRLKDIRRSPADRRKKKTKALCSCSRFAFQKCRNLLAFSGVSSCSLFLGKRIEKLLHMLTVLIGLRVHTLLFITVNQLVIGCRIRMNILANPLNLVLRGNPVSPKDLIKR